MSKILTTKQLYVIETNLLAIVKNRIETYGAVDSSRSGSQKPVHRDRRQGRPRKHRCECVTVTTKDRVGEIYRKKQRTGKSDTSGRI